MADFQSLVSETLFIELDNTQKSKHQTVRITIEPRIGWADRTAGMLQWTGDPEVLRRIAEAVRASR